MEVEFLPLAGFLIIMEPLGLRLDGAIIPYIYGRPLMKLSFLKVFFFERVFENNLG